MTDTESNDSLPVHYEVTNSDGETVVEKTEDILIRRIQKSAGDLTYHTIRLDERDQTRADNWRIITEVRESKLQEAAAGFAIAAEILSDR